MKRFIIAPLLCLTAISALAWGQKGHDVTAAIAEKHLTPATKAAVDSILEGQSMVYWANWLDNANEGIAIMIATPHNMPTQRLGIIRILTRVCATRKPRPILPAM